MKIIENSFQIRRALLSSDQQTFGHRLTLLTRPTSISGEPRGSLRRSALTLSLVGFLLSTTALANPQGGQVVDGSATIVESGPKRLDVIQHTPRAVIDWRSFDIAADEHTNFAQPSSSAVALNRVTAGGASQIRGRLTANGTVMLINPHGVIFGPSARVDVAGLVASTADVRTSDAMAGRFVFDLPGQPDAIIRNEGEITVADHGLVAMVAPWVANTGLIRARLGRVTLASGEAFTLDPYGDSLVEVMLTEAPAGGDGARIVNDGLIAADGGVVTLSAEAVKSAFDQAINMTGVIEARSVASANGVIRLRGGNGETRVAGRLDASGRTADSTGGRVEVRGRRVSLADDALVLASGHSGGGRVNIGGDMHGQGPDRQAETTRIAATARIEADALATGDGGDVVVWADDTTRFQGAISARGGADGGDGGFVEVSGKERLQFAGTVDASAPAGAAGTLLLDPRNITVRTGGAAAAGDVDGFGDGGDTALVIDPATLDAVMASVVLQATEDITIDDAVNLTTSGAGLTARAGRNITVDAGITTRGGDITLSANDPGTTQANGSIAVNAALDTTGGGQAGGAVALDVNGGSGGIALGADITTSNANVTVDGPATLSGDVTVASGGGDITFAGALNGGQDLTLAAGGGDIALQGAVGGSSRLDRLRIDSARDVVANAITATSLRQVAGSGTTTFNGALSTNTGAGVNLTGNAFTLNAAVTTINGGGLRIDNSSGLSIAPAADLNLDGAFAQTGAGAVSLAGDITTTGDAIGFSAPVTLTGNVALDTGSGSGNITFAGTLDGGQNLTLTAGSGDIELQAAAGGNSRLAALTVNSARDVTSTSIEAANLRQIAGSGTTRFNGALNTNGSGGIDLDGNAFAVTAGVSTSNGGGLRITNTGTLNLGTAADLNLDGVFAQDGAGAVSLAGDITTSGDTIGFAGPVTLSGDVALGTGGGNIDFANTLNGNRNIALTAGSGDISFRSAVGGANRLGAMTINSARDVTVNNLTAGSLRQVAGSGTTTFNGVLDTDGGSGIDLDGNAFAINAGAIASNGGGMRITNAGNLSFGATADLDLDGAFAQDGAGGVSLAGNIATTGDVISFASAVTLIGTTTLNSAGGDITFADTIDGGQNLSLAAGAGDIAFQAAAGGVNRLGALTIDSARDVTVNAMTASSLRQLAGSGTTIFADALNTNGAVGIDLVGNAFEINAEVTTSNGGAVRVDNADELSIVADLNLDGAFHQTGDGATSLTADIATSNDAIAFTGPVSLAGIRSLDSGAAGVSFDGDVVLVDTTLTANGPLTLGSGAEDRITVFAGPATIATSNDEIVVNGVLRGFRNVTIDSGTADTVFNADVGRFVSGGTTFLAPIGSGTGPALDLRTRGETIFNGEVFAGSGIVAAGAVRFRDDVTLQAGDTDSSFAGTTLFDAADGSLVFATGGTVSFDGDVGLLSSATLQVTEGPIVFNGAVNGPSSLTTAAGGNDVVFNGAVGASVRPFVNVFNARDIVFGQPAEVAGASLRADGQIELGRGTAGGLDSTGNINIQGDADVAGDLRATGSILIAVTGDVDVDATANTRLTVSGGNIGGRYASIGADPNVSEVTLNSSQRIDAEIRSTGKVTLTGGSGITATVAAGGISELITTEDINANVTTQSLRVSGTSTADLSGSVGGDSGIGGARLIDIFLINDDALRGPFFFNGIDILNLENFVVTRTTMVPPVDPQADFGFGTGRDIVQVPITISSEQDLAAQLGLSIEEARALIALAKQAEDSGTTVVARPGGGAGSGGGTIVVAARSGTEVREGGSGFAVDDTTPGPVQVADSFAQPERNQSQDLTPQEAAAIAPAGGGTNGTANEDEEETETADSGRPGAETAEPVAATATAIRISALYAAATDGAQRGPADLAATSANQFNRDYALVEPLAGAETAFPGLKDFNRSPLQ